MDDILTGDLDNKSQSFLEFVTQLSSRIVWEYSDEKTQISDLYEIAKEKFWNASRDIDWSSNNPRLSWPTQPESNPLFGFKPYDLLPSEERIRISWWQHGLEISEVLHGEQGALIIASQLVSCMPTMEAKLFASSQVSDEARHVEFFSRYLTDIVGLIYPPSKELERFIRLMVDDPRWDMKFIACQILIESLAMAKFQEIKSKSLNPILTFAVDYIAKDEARHVKFGTTLLEDYINSLSDHEIQERSDFVLDNILRLANAQNIYSRIAEEMSWDKTALRYHLRKYRISHPEINRNKFRQLSINLDSVGLLTDKTIERMASIQTI
ncbi:ferritin-like domain-containing protein [Aurantivibrio plasticivorans]